MTPAKTPNRRKQLFFHELQIRLLTINIAYFAAILLIFAVALSRFKTRPEDLTPQPAGS